MNKNKIIYTFFHAILLSILWILIYLVLIYKDSSSISFRYMGFQESKLLEQIESKIIKEVEMLASKKIIDKNMEIFKNGYLDSLNVLHIILFLESEFNIKIDMYDISIDELGTINKIILFVERKLNIQYDY